jgi:hypothetical protein
MFKFFKLQLKTPRVTNVSIIFFDIIYDSNYVLLHPCILNPLHDFMI